MFKEKMKLVAYSDGVNIFNSEKGTFSFFNSPYPSHLSFTGIDLYPKGSFGDIAPSPVNGEVLRIRAVKCPKGKYFSGSTRDFVILLRSLENPKRWIKILHVAPSVKVGDVLEPGFNLGTLLRSGFFNFWTDPHIHVEVRKPSDPIRARGGSKFERIINVGVKKVAKELTGIVIETKSEYSLVALKEKFKLGIPVELEGTIGILDAGIPHYRFIGVHLDTVPPINGSINLCGRKIGIVKYAHSGMCVAKSCNPIFKLKGKIVGVSLNLFPSSSPLIKIVPQRPNELPLKKFEEVSLVIS